MAGIIDESLDFIPLNIAILTVSDTRTAETDSSGDTLQKLATDAGHIVKQRTILKDTIPEIQTKIQEWIDNKDIHVVITTGGTGLTGRDVTVEAVKPLYSKEIDGFSVIFHQISFQTVGTSTLQSRACAGLCKDTLVFSLPGSNGACKDGWNGILKYQLDSRHMPCNFVEIIPRMLES